MGFDMMYWRYFLYLLKHKWYVGVECFKRGLFWRGIVHDNDKFLPTMFIPYARHFYKDGGGINRGRDQYGHYNPADTGDKVFDIAVLSHINKSKHHWQWWIITKDDGSLNIKDMPVVYKTEMLCDWIGAARAQGRIKKGDNVLECLKIWWDYNKTNIYLHPDTRKHFENILNNE